MANVQAHREESTYLSYRNTWEKWLKPYCAKRKLEQLGTLDIQSAVDAARAEGKNRTEIYTLSVAKRMLNAARRHSPPYIVHDPCTGVVVPDDAQERERILSHDEVDEVLMELSRSKPLKTKEGATFRYRHRHLIRFILETGTRRSEACAVHLFNVDLLSDEPEVRISSQVAVRGSELTVKPYTKGKKLRSIPLTDAAIEALREHQEMVKEERKAAGQAYQEMMLAFPSEEGTPINPHNVHRTILRLQEAINERRTAERLPTREPWTLHDLRRTFGTRIAQTGANMKETQTLLGHARMQTTAKIYVVAEKDGLRKAVKNMKNRKSG